MFPELLWTRSYRLRWMRASFQEAAAQVRNDLPTLTPPKKSRSSRRLGGRGLPDGEHQCPITEMSAEQRKENREVMKAQTDSIAMSMEQQADEIRKRPWRSSSAASFPGRSTSAWALSSSAWA